MIRILLLALCLTQGAVFGLADNLNKFLLEEDITKDYIKALRLNLGDCLGNIPELDAFMVSMDQQKFEVERKNLSVGLQFFILLARCAGQKAEGDCLDAIKLTKLLKDTSEKREREIRKDLIYNNNLSVANRELLLEEFEYCPAKSKCLDELQKITKAMASKVKKYNRLS